MYKMSRVVYRVDGGRFYALTLPAAQATGLKYEVEYIPIEDESTASDTMAERHSKFA